MNDWYIPQPLDGPMALAMGGGQKKSRQPLQNTVSVGSTSHVGLTPLNISIQPHAAPDIASEGVDGEGSSQTVLRGDSGDGGGDVAHGCTSRLADGTVLIAAQERGGVQEIPSNAPGHKHFVPDVPSLSTERGPEAVVERPTGVPPEQVSGNHVKGAVPDPIRSDKPECVIGKVTIPVDEATSGFGSLKTLLSVIYPDYKEAILVGNKIEDLLSRITGLEEDFDSKPSDVGEQRRRDNAIRKLKGIEQQLRLSYRGQGSQKLTGSCKIDDCVLELLDDLRETLSDYQMWQQTRGYDRNCKNISRDEAVVLNSFRCAPGAEFRHGNRKGCLKGTRGTVLDEIELWTRNPNTPPVYWLNGLAGTGKTTIAQTIAERTFACGQLGASFFCSRDYQDRSNLHLIFPTLAIQLARKYTDFRTLFVSLAQSDPGIAHESLYNQMRKLIVEPLEESKISTVIVIDALDECADEEPASAILSVLGQFVSEIPNVKFLVTGRPEPRIREGFRLPLLAEATEVFVLHEVEQSQVEKDIRLFFKHKFSELVSRRPGLDGWPTEEQLDLFCKRAAGLFVYAVATVKFIDKQSANPREQLNLLLQSPESSVREARIKFNTNSTLDSLYISILQGAFGDSDDPDNDPRVRSVLGVVALAATPLSPSTIAMLLGLDPQSVFPLLSSVQSLLVLQENIDYPVRPFHKSFPDFIVDPDRCTNQRFYIFRSHHHSQLLIACLDLMYQMLEKNMCKLPNAVANSDIGNTKERVKQCVDPALQYACKWWHTHLVDKHEALAAVQEITDALNRFLKTKFLFWLEVLSALGAVRNAVDALQAVVDLLEQSPTLDLVYDCSRFLSAHFEIINASSPHIYHSALALTPRTSIVWKLYESHAQPLARVVCGLPVSWDSNIAATTRPSRIKLATWSPCNKFIAISSLNSMTVDILDSMTLQKLQSLKSKSSSGYVNPEILVFSPDSRILTSSGANGREMLVASWDLQTGGIMGMTRRELPDMNPLIGAYITHSTDGKMVAILRQSSYKSIAISIYDTVTCKYMHDVYTTGNTIFCGFWTHGKYIRLAAIGLMTGGPGPTPITVWEIGFTPGATKTEVETLSIPESAKFLGSGGARLPQSIMHPRSPLAPRPVVLVYSTRPSDVLVWDAQNSKILLHCQDANHFGKSTFSSDGRFFACSTAKLEVHLWKESPIGYVLHGKLTPSTGFFTPLLSPNGESIVAFGDFMVKLWHTKSLATTPSNSSIEVPHQTNNFILELLPDRLLAAAMRQGGSTVTLLDLKSGRPQLTINTGMEARGLGVRGETIVVIGDREVTAWELPGGSFLPNATMNVTDNTWTISLGGSRRNLLMLGLISPDFRYIAVKEVASQELYIYSASTGKCLGHSFVQETGVWFTPDSQSIGYAISGSRGRVRKITAEGTLDWSHPIVDIEQGQWGCPYRSTRGYRLTSDGWILSPSGKRLLILPPLWRSPSYVKQQMWNGQFLALLHGTLPEPVIIELEG